jgi:Trk K+ transport system NAD-binding subunit
VLSLRITAQCPGLGRSLADLALEARTGTTLLGLTRAGQPLDPAGPDPLQVDDLVTVGGPPAAVEATRRMLDPEA